MTDNDNIKALEWCEQFENNIVFRGNGDKKCVQALQVLVVIKHALKEYNRQQAEIERLNKKLIEQELKNNMLYETSKEVKSETVKEVTEKLKSIFGEWLYDYKTEDLLKEMVGENNG